MNERGDVAQPTDDLPSIPGGWTSRTLQICERSFALTLPADPDAFLDDVCIRARNAETDYMPYWAYLWPASEQMAAFVLQHQWSAGTRVLEVGAGLGLVGLAADACGLQVTFSDYDPTALCLVRHNARHNGVADPQTMTLDWRSPPDVRLPLIFACDVLYECQNHAPILLMLEAVLTEHGRCFIGEPGRQHAEAFVTHAEQADWRVAYLDACGIPLARYEPGRFQVIELSRQQQDGDLSMGCDRRL